MLKLGKGEYSLPNGCKGSYSPLAFTHLISSEFWSSWPLLGRGWFQRQQTTQRGFYSERNHVAVLYRSVHGLILGKKIEMTHNWSFWSFSLGRRRKNFHPELPQRESVSHEEGSKNLGPPWYLYKVFSWPLVVSAPSVELGSRNPFQVLRVWTY